VMSMDDCSARSWCRARSPVARFRSCRSSFAAPQAGASRPTSPSRSPGASFRCLRRTGSAGRRWARRVVRPSSRGTATPARPTIVVPPGCGWPVPLRPSVGSDRRKSSG
jgi:hypothetical protein